MRSVEEWYDSRGRDRCTQDVRTIGLLLRLEETTEKVADILASRDEGVRNAGLGKVFGNLGFAVKWGARVSSFRPFLH